MGSSGFEMQLFDFLSENMDSIESIVLSFAQIFNFGMKAASFIVGVVGVVLAFLGYIIFHIVKTIPVYAAAKKT